MKNPTHMPPDDYDDETLPGWSLFETPRLEDEFDREAYTDFVIGTKDLVVDICVGCEISFRRADDVLVNVYVKARRLADYNNDRHNRVWVTEAALNECGRIVRARAEAKDDLERLIVNIQPGEPHWTPRAIERARELRELSRRIPDPKDRQLLFAHFWQRSMTDVILRHLGRHERVLPQRLVAKLGQVAKELWRIA